MASEPATQAPEPVPQAPPPMPEAQTQTPSQEAQESVLRQRKPTEETTPADQAKKPVLKKKKKIIIDWRLNALLTLLYALTVLWTIYTLKSEPESLIVVALMIPVVHIVVTTTKTLFEKFGRILSQNCIRGVRDPLAQPLAMKKWRDQSWQLVIHAGMTILEIWVLSGETWWDQPITTFYLNNVTADFSPDPSTLKLSLRVVYLVQLAIWIYTAFMHRFYEAPRKDYFEMYAHHVLTIALVIGSYSFRYLRIGVLVFYIHDSSDIFIDLLKMTNYLKCEGPQNLFLTEIAYVTSIVTWFYWRLYHFPARIIHCTAIQMYQRINPGKYFFEDPSPANMPWYLTSNGMLILLFGLHIYWILLLLKIGYKMISGVGAHSAGREDYEGESSDADANN